MRASGTTSTKETGRPDHAYAEKRRPRQIEPQSTANPPSSSDHPYASAASRSDHPYSAKDAITLAETDRPRPAQIAKEESQQQLQVRLKKLDHLYSSPSSPSSPGTSHHQQPTSSRKCAAAKRQSVRAIGHSYAAARPRRTSTGGEGGRRSAALYPCDQCDKVFPQPYRLNRHIREVHVRERRHTCKYCDKSFFKVTSKERHELTHTEHQLWKCPECQKCFRDQTSLKYHRTKNVCLKRSAKDKDS